MTLFKLEEKIMSAWNTKEDINLLYSEMLDGDEPLTEDNIANTLIGIENLHSMRMNQLWSEFEEVCHQNASNNNPKKDIKKQELLYIIEQAFSLLKNLESTEYQSWKNMRDNLIYNFYINKSNFI